MDNKAITEFMPALGRAIGRVSGIHNSRLWDENYVPTNKWPAFLAVLCQELGSAWEVGPAGPANPAYTAASTARPLPILFKRVQVEQDGKRLFKLQFLMYTVQ